MYLASKCAVVFSLGFFWVVQQHLKSLVHHLDHNGMQLRTNWVQSKVMDGFGQIYYSCTVEPELVVI